MCVHSFDKPYPWISANLVPITPLRLRVGFQTKAACRQFRLLFHLHFQMQYILIYFFLANQFVITKANKDETVKMNLIWGFLSNNISFLIIFFFWFVLWGVVFWGVLEGFFGGVTWQTLVFYWFVFTAYQIFAGYLKIFIYLKPENICEL